MKDSFVSYAIALLAKVKQFNEPCSAYYRKLLGTKETILYRQEETEKAFINSKLGDNKFKMVAVPLYTELLSWFEKKNVHIEPITLVDEDGIVSKKIRVLMILPAPEWAQKKGAKFSQRDFKVDTIDEAITKAFEFLS